MQNRVVLKVPEGSTSCSVGGVEYKTDKDGNVTVPHEFMDQLKAHGFIVLAGLSGLEAPTFTDPPAPPAPAADASSEPAAPPAAPEEAPPAPEPVSAPEEAPPASEPDPAVAPTPEAEEVSPAIEVAADVVVEAPPAQE